MPNMHIGKSTFAGGEYAPSLWARVDIQKYASGAKKLKNVIVHPHGGASNAPGTHFVAKKKYGSAKKCRIHDFQFSSTQTFIIEFGDYYARFYTNNGQIQVSSASAWVGSHSYSVGDYVTHSSIIYYCISAHTSGTFATDLSGGKWTAQTIYEIPTPYAETDLAALTFTQSADVLFMFHPNYQTRELIRYGATDWRIELYDFLYGPFMLPNDNTTFTITPSGTTGSITLTASSALFTADHIGALFQTRHSIAEQSVTQGFSATGATSSIRSGGTWRIITHGTWSGKVVVQKSTDGGTTWTNVRTFDSNSDFNANTFGTEDMSNNADPFLVRANMTTYTSGTCNVTLTTDAFYQTGVTKITAYSSSTSVTGTVKKQIGATTATFEWAEGSWSDYRGWPSVGEFFQDRLATGGSDAEQMTSWLSKTSNYYDYSRNTPLVDSDAISINLPARQLNRINGFVPLKALIALTSSSEWSIGTPGNPLTPTTANQNPNGYTGSSGVKPVIVRNRAIFVQAMGAMLADMGYSLAEDSFTGADISVFAQHLFNGYTIKDLAYQQYPDSLVWAVRSDGVLLCMTYMREQEVLAWTWHTTEGQYESIAVIPSSGYNQLWMSVNRGNEGYIEYMDHRMTSKDVKDQFFVHCGIIYDGSPTSVVSGLEHLEGMEVAVLADGNVLANALEPMVVTGGQITLDSEYSKVIIGIPYVSDIQLLNIDAPLQDGTAQGRKARVSKVTLRMLNSRGGWLGADEDNLTEISNSVRQYYDSAIDLFTGDIPHTIGPGYQDGGSVFFRQYDPLPFTMLGMVPVISYGGTQG